MENIPLSKNDIIFFRSTLLLVLEQLGSPFCLGLYLRLNAGVSLTGIEVLPTNYIDPAKYLIDVQALSLFKKNPWFFKDSTDLAANALEKFLASERQCYETNTKFWSYDFASFGTSRVMSDKQPQTRDVLRTARHFAGKILGKLDLGHLSFGPGATSAVSGRDTNVISKLRTKPECTALAYNDVFAAIFMQIPHYAIACGLLERTKGDLKLLSRKVNIVEGNRFTTVPKDWRSDRPICIEPHGNMIIQKAYGDYIRKRLCRYGYDINHLQELHGEYARQSSLTDCYATIDLSSASDTIARKFVASILPDDWYFALNSVRSHYTILPDGSKMLNEKFSSMGNGFTFELETLLFLSLGLAVRHHFGKSSDLVSAYGDDIVIDVELAAPLEALLVSSGFTLNREKSFIYGPFKESCGFDYFNGIRVRPIFIKELPNDKILGHYTFANRIREVFNRVYHDDNSPSHRSFICGDSYRLWNNIVRRIPSALRYFGPSSCGDAVIFASLSESKPEYRDGCLRVASFQRESKRFKTYDTPDHQLACALYGVPSGGVIPRSVAFRIKRKYLYPVNWV